MSQIGDKLLLLFTQFRAVFIVGAKTLQNTSKNKGPFSMVLGNGDPIGEVCFIRRISRASEQQMRNKRMRQTSE